MPYSNPSYKSVKQLKEIEKMLEKLYPLLAEYWSLPNIQDVVNYEDWCRYDHVARLLHRIKAEIDPEDFLTFATLRDEDKVKQTMSDAFDYGE